MSKRLQNHDNEEQSTGQIASLFWESLYHNSIIADDDSIGEKFGSSQLGDDPQHEIDEQLQEPVRKAATEGKSEQGCKSPQATLKKQNNIFKLRLEAGVQKT